MSKLEDAFTKAYKDPEFKTFIKGIYVNDVYRNSKDFTAKIMRDFDRQTGALKDLKGRMMGE
jgi:tripartite-type tricarboxylate transporter receptor subunit TctC